MKGIITILIIIFLVFGAYVIIQDNEIDMDSKDGKISFAKKYFGWVGNLGKNVKNTVGYAVKQDWMPEDSKTYVIEEEVE